MLKTTGIGDGEFLEYKGRPLVRQGDDIYYGDLQDKYYIFMIIINSSFNFVSFLYFYFTLHMYSCFSLN